MTTKTVFMGSPQFVVPVMNELIAHYKVCGVVTQPDRPAGRGKKLTPPAVKVRAMEEGIPLIQPNKLSESGVYEQIKSWNPDFIVVAAFGQILRKNLLELPVFGCINVHASLLPRWRGVSPIQTAILKGDLKSGITIMKMDEGIDTGPILRKKEMKILPEDTSETLTNKLFEMGAPFLIDVLEDWIDKKIEPIKQVEDQATYAYKIKKQHGLLDLNKSSEDLINQIRAYDPWPGSFVQVEEMNIKIHQAVSTKGESRIGERIILEGLPAIGIADGWLVLKILQPPGKKPMEGRGFLNGARYWIQDK
ncbi:MAG: methionyl-tRNA formyltransferase [Anaerolineaceae bacterium]|nr:methionyl-tRNA formyltransferase [Anaerolineaceae bacterium]